MTREQLLAAEIYGYSFDHYADHLGVGNVRFESLMPQDARALEGAANEGWPLSKVAKMLDVDAERAAELTVAFERARKVVDAENPADLFRNAVRYLIQDAAIKGLNDAESIESLVTQVCFRVADLSFVLKAKDERLSRYSRHFRSEPGITYPDGYFDGPEKTV